MKRMKTFLIYLLLVLAVVLLTNPLANLILSTNYKDITRYEITTTSPEINITESKATKVNGYIKGNVTNKADYFIPNVYVKIELKSDNGTTLGTEYIKMGNFQPDQSKDFSLDYRYSGVNGFIVSTTNKAEETKSIEDDPIFQNVKKYYPIVRLAAWAITPGYLFLPLFLFSTGR